MNLLSEFPPKICNTTKLPGPFRISGGYGATRRNINCCIWNFWRCCCLGRPRTGGVAISSGQEVQGAGRRPGGTERKRRRYELHSATADSQEERFPQPEDSTNQHEGPRVSRKFKNCSNNI